MQALTHALLFLILFILVCIWQDQLLTDEDKKKINSNRTFKESLIITFTYLFITILYVSSKKNLRFFPTKPEVPVKNNVLLIQSLKLISNLAKIKANPIKSIYLPS